MKDDVKKNQVKSADGSLSEQAIDDQVKRFVEITPERVLQMVERTGVKTTGRVLQLNSMENRVYEVEIETSEEKSKYDRYRVVKFMRPGRWSYEQIKEEHLYLSSLQKEGIAVGAPLVFESGDTIARDLHSGIMAVVFPRIGGRSPDELSNELYLQLGSLLARTHIVGASLPINTRQRLDVETYGSLNLDWIYQNALLPEDLENQYLDVAEEVIEMSRPILKSIAYQPIHGDCHLGNVLYGSSGLFLVDFDDMVIGPKVQDFWLLVSGTDDWGKKQLEVLIKGYEQIAKFDHTELEAIEPLRALRYIHYASWIARRWKDPAFPRAFPHFGTREFWLSQLRDLLIQKEKITAGL